MAGLLIIFVVTLTYVMLTLTHQQAAAQDQRVEYQARVEELTQTRERRRDMLKELEERLHAASVSEFLVDGDRGVLRLKEGILFESGQDSILPDGRRVIEKLGPILVEVLRSEKYSGVETVFVEGHTDTVPVRTGARFKDNWDLSTKRAISAWKALQLAAPELVKLENQTGEPLFSCSGYAATRPVIQGATDSISLRQNRRIDFRFTMTPPLADDESAADSIASRMLE